MFATERIGSNLKRKVLNVQFHTDRFERELAITPPMSKPRISVQPPAAVAELKQEGKVGSKRRASRRTKIVLSDEEDKDEEYLDTTCKKKQKNVAGDDD